MLYNFKAQNLDGEELGRGSIDVASVPIAANVAREQYPDSVEVHVWADGEEEPMPVGGVPSNRSIVVGEGVRVREFLRADRVPQPGEDEITVAGQTRPDTHIDTSLPTSFLSPEESVE